MSKVILYLKKFWWVAALTALYILYLIIQKDPKVIVVKDPTKPETEDAPDILGQVRKELEKIDEELKNSSRSDLVDDINSDYE